MMCCGNLELYGSEVPDGLDAALHHLIGHRLRHFSRGGDDSQMNAHPRGQIGQLLQGQYRLLVDPLADLGRVGVEGRHDPQAELGEPLVAQQRRAQVPHPDQKRLVHVVPAQKRLDGLDEFGDRVAGLRLADDPRVLQILADLHRDAAQVPADHAARDPGDSFGLKIHQIMVVLGQAPQAWLRDRRRFGAFDGQHIR